MSATKEPKKRNYVQEYKYHAQPLQIARRADRNKSRRAMEKKGAVKKGDGKDVDHKNRNKRGRLNTAVSNLRIKSKSANRANNQ